MSRDEIEVMVETPIFEAVIAVTENPEAATNPRPSWNFDEAWERLFGPTESEQFGVSLY